MTEENRRLCRNIRYLRRRDGLSQKEMGEILGVSPGVVRKIEREEESVRLMTGMLVRVFNAFGLTGDRMLYEDLEKNVGRRHASAGHFRD